MADKTKLELWHLGDLVETGEDSPNGLLLLKAKGVEYQQDWAKISPFVGEMSIERAWQDREAITADSDGYAGFGECDFPSQEIWTWDGKKVWNVLNRINELFWK